jgi:hypothetical protein
MLQSMWGFLTPELAVNRRVVGLKSVQQRFAEGWG